MSVKCIAIERWDVPKFAIPFIKLIEKASTVPWWYCFEIEISILDEIVQI